MTITETAPRGEGMPESKDRRSVKTREGLQKLLADNGSTRIINENHLQNIFGTRERMRLDPGGFQDVQTVKVRTASGEVKELIRDGHHRAKAAEMLWDTIEKKHGIGPEKGQFEFATYDMTTVALDRFYDPTDLNRPKELTMEQYWKDIITPTRQHSELESKRTLGHIIMGWEDMVGTELAQKYTGFAAIALLTSDEARRSTWRDGKGIEKYLSDVFAGIPEQDAICTALLETHGVMQDLIEATHETTKISLSKLQDEAVLLMGPDAVYIGGEDVARNEVAGLIHLPQIVQKTGGFGSSLKSDLTSFFANDTLTLAHHFNSVFTALTNPDFTLNEAHEVLNDKKNPRSKFLNVEEKVNKRRKIRSFENRYGRPATEFERGLLEKTTRNALSPYTITTIGNVVAQAEDIGHQVTDVQTAAVLATQLKNLKTFAQGGKDHHFALAALEKTIGVIRRGGTIPYEAPTTRDRVLDSPPGRTGPSAPIDMGEQHRAHILTLMTELSRLKQRAEHAEAQITEATTQTGEKDTHIAELTTRLADATERNRELEAENVILRARISELEAQGETASPDATPVTVFRADALEDDKTMLIDIEATAKKIFVTKDAKSQKITEEKWAWLKDNLVYGMHHGLDAISHSLLPRMRTLREATKWEPNDPRIKLLIASHYLELVRAQEMKGVEGEMMSAIVDFKEKKSIPWSYVYTRLLEILLYADPVTDHETRSASLRFLNQGSSTMDFNQAQQEVVIPFLREKNLSWNEYIRRVLTPASELEEDTS